MDVAEVMCTAKGYVCDDLRNAASVTWRGTVTAPLVSVREEIFLDVRNRDLNTPEQAIH